MTEPLPPGQKALQVNLDQSRYGTIAEIGAGQEVAGWFFRVGGAAGTVAKSISAYDMTVSDGIYGKSPRYVSEERLRQMLDREYAALMESLAPTRGATTAFFAFADTVATRSYTRAEDGAGWLGTRFQDHPGAEPSQIVLHVRLLDSETVPQQQALGLLGVNLIYATAFLHHDVNAFIVSLGDSLGRERLELDFVDVSGPVFAGHDPRHLSLGLLKKQLARGVMFGRDGRAVEPSLVLYKKALSVLPGSFRPVLQADLDRLAAAAEQLRADGGDDERRLSLAHITTVDPHGTVDAAADVEDLLARVDVLSAVGLPALVTDIAEPHHLAAYLGRYTKTRVVFVVGAGTFEEVFREKRFEALDGGVFEALSRLFKRWVRVAIYPSPDHRTGVPLTARSIPVGPEYAHLLQHLLDTGLIRELKMPGVPAPEGPPAGLIEDLRRGGTAWEPAVPAPAVAAIKARRLFGYATAAFEERRR